MKILSFPMISFSAKTLIYRFTNTRQLVNVEKYIHKSSFQLNLTCWSCEKETKLMINDLFCEHCKSLQKPDPAKNYFRIMNVPETYDLDDTELANKYKSLQRLLHPDKFSIRDKTEQSISEEYSSLVNEAYQTLLEPLSRGTYMLKLKGQELPESTQLDQEFLMDIMEKNEIVENAETKEEIIELQTENKKMIEKLSKDLSAAFFAGKLDKVISILSHMKYYASIDQQIKKLIREKGIIQ